MYTDVKHALELQVAAKAAERTGRIRAEVKLQMILCTD